MRISDWSSDVCSSDLADWLEGLLAHEGIEPDPGIKDALWSALGSLASAPACERTLRGLCALLQENRLRQVLAPYLLGGPHRSAERRVGTAGVTTFKSRWSPYH